jgi:hypothetical protein
VARRCQVGSNGWLVLSGASFCRSKTFLSAIRSAPCWASGGFVCAWTIEQERNEWDQDGYLCAVESNSRGEIRQLDVWSPCSVHRPFVDSRWPTRSFVLCFLALICSLRFVFADRSSIARLSALMTSVFFGRSIIRRFPRADVTTCAILGWVKAIVGFREMSWHLST